MQFNHINDCEFDKLDDNLLEHYSRMYINDVIVFIGATSYLPYNNLIEQCIHELAVFSILPVEMKTLKNILPLNLQMMKFVTQSTIAIFNNLYTKDIIPNSLYSLVNLENGQKSDRLYNPILLNIICNYQLIPFLKLSTYYNMIVISEDDRIEFDIEKAVMIIYDSCVQFDGEN